MGREKLFLMRDEGDLPPRGGGARLVADDAEQKLRRQFTGLELIVRLGTMRNQGICVIDNRVREIGVMVEGDDEGFVVADQSTYDPEQIRLGIVNPVGDGRSMQSKIHGIEWSCVAQALLQRLGEVGEGFLRQRPTGPCPAMDDGNRCPIELGIHRL